MPCPQGGVASYFPRLAITAPPAQSGCRFSMCCIMETAVHRVAPQWGHLREGILAPIAVPFQELSHHHQGSSEGPNGDALDRVILEGVSVKKEHGGE